jgi:hypothetical protein
MAPWINRVCADAPAVATASKATTAQIRTWARKRVPLPVEECPTSSRTVAGFLARVEALHPVGNVGTTSQDGWLSAASTRADSAVARPHRSPDRSYLLGESSTAREPGALLVPCGERRSARPVRRPIVQTRFSSSPPGLRGGKGYPNAWPGHPACDGDPDRALVRARPHHPPPRRRMRLRQRPRART